MTTWTCEECGKKFVARSKRDIQAKRRGHAAGHSRVRNRLAKAGRKAGRKTEQYKVVATASRGNQHSELSEAVTTNRAVTRPSLAMKNVLDDLVGELRAAHQLVQECGSADRAKGMIDVITEVGTF